MKIKRQSLSDRKKEHIELATKSQVSNWSNDQRFFYEPLLGNHQAEQKQEFTVFDKSLKFPLWVSSMTGGTPEARQINEHLAQACAQFGLGMGLGSCRLILENPKKYLADFNVRSFISPAQPLFANLGIAQMEKELEGGNQNKIMDMIGLLEADGLIIHVNPLQEWLQPEGDRISRNPIDVIKEFISKCETKVIVKEVGQGMGPESLLELMKLPVMVEFGAFGGTNFSQLEISRSNGDSEASYQDLVNIGHNIDEMIEFTNAICAAEKELQFKGVIASGGVKTFLDGFYAVNKLSCHAIYGQASELLKPARTSYELLEKYIQGQIEGYHLAQQYLRIR